MSAEEGASFPIAFLTAEFCLGHLARHARGRARADPRGGRRRRHGGGAARAARRRRGLRDRRLAVEARAAARHGRRRTCSTRAAAAFADEILARHRTGAASTWCSIRCPASSSTRASACSRAAGASSRSASAASRRRQWVAALDRDLRYFVVDWGETGERDPALIGGMLARLVDDLRQGTPAPLPRHVFAPRRAPTRVPLHGAGAPRGKIVVRHGAHAPRRRPARRHLSRHRRAVGPRPRWSHAGSPSTAPVASC